MKKILFIWFQLIWFLWNVTLQAQNPTLEWVKQMGGAGDDEANFVNIDKNGNIYTVGCFAGTVDFDPSSNVYNLTSFGGWDIYVQKLDSSGNFIWAKQMGGGASNDFGTSVTTDSSGNIYITGSFSGFADFDPSSSVATLSPLGYSDVFILKLNSSGAFDWVKRIGGALGDGVNSISTDLFGNIYVTGYFQSNVTFNLVSGLTALTSNGSYDIYILKLDSLGNFLWVKGMGGISYDRGTSIVVDKFGQSYTTGYFSDTVDFNPGSGSEVLASQGGTDVFILKLNDAGNLIWVKQIRGAGGTNGMSIVVDDDGSVYSTGSFQDVTDFDPSVSNAYLYPNGSADIYILKLDSIGNYNWVKQMGGTGNDIPKYLTIDKFSNIYTIGDFSETVDFDPSSDTTFLTAVNNKDIFVQKLNKTGDFKWAISMGSVQDDFGFAIDIDSEDKVYAVGAFRAMVDFNPNSGTTNLLSNGGTDGFLQKLNQCIYKTTDIISACDSFTWIDNKTYYSSNNSAFQFYNSSDGCDSIVTLDLTIYQVSDITTSIYGITITSNNTNATYQWLNCDNNYSEILGETGQSFTPTMNGNYAVELTENGCVDTSHCVPVNGVGFIENDFEGKLQVYPNPTNEELSIELSSDYKHVTILLSDINGKLMKQEEIQNNNTIKLLISEPNGIYFLTIISQNKKAVIKIVKE